MLTTCEMIEIDKSSFDFDICDHPPRVIISVNPPFVGPLGTKYQEVLSLGYKDCVQKVFMTL